MGCGTPNVTNFSLAGSHAYTVLGTRKVVDKDGNDRYLIKFRNPWNSDAGYSNRWNDTDPAWATIDCAKSDDGCNHLSNKFDGISYIEAIDFLQAFDVIWIGHINDNYVLSSKRVLDATEEMEFKFTTTS